jgi:hypothetical protein
VTVQAYKGTISPPTTGTVPVRANVIGMPFAPLVVLFFSASTATLNGSVAGLLECFGAATALNQFVVANGSDAAVTTSNAGRISRTTECVCLPLNGTPAIDVLGRLASLNGDGFSVDWTDLAASSGMVVHYLAIGGEDILNATIVEITPSTTTNGATQAVTVGFMPDAIIFASPAVPSTAGIVDANICIGAARRLPSTQQYATFWFENDATTTRDCAVYSTTARCVALPSSTAVKDADASIASWDAAGFTLTWDDAPATLTQKVYAICIQGGQWQIDALQTATVTGTQSVTTAFQPRGVMLFSTSDATDADTTASAATTDSAFAIGAADDALRQGANSFLQQDGNATSFAKRRTSTTKVISHMTGTAGTLQSEAAVTGMGASSFTLNWTTANATQKRFAALSMGDNAVQNPFVFNTPIAPGAGGAP